MATVFVCLMAFDAIIYVREDYRFAMFGFEQGWIYVAIVSHILILSLLGLLANNTYRLYTDEYDYRQQILTTQAAHLDECQRLKRHIEQEKSNISQSDYKYILDNIQRIVGHMYSLMMEDSAAIMAIDNKLKINSSSIADYKHSFNTGDRSLESIHTIICKILDLSLSVEEKLDRAGGANALATSGLQSLVSRLEKVDSKLSSSLKVLSKIHLPALNETVDELRKVEENLKESVSEGKSIHKYEALKIKLMEGQLNQIMERTEILDSAQKIIHKYAALMDSSKGDITEFLRLDEMLSKPVSELNLSRDITRALIRNGLDTIESLVLNDAPTIQELSHLGPKRMQRLEAALKNYSPELSFGMM